MIRLKKVEEKLIEEFINEFRLKYYDIYLKKREKIFLNN